SSAMEESRREIPIGRGVKQGCVLDPVLFNLYFADLCAQLNSASAHPPKIGDQLLTALLYADDIILLNLSGKGLQKLLNTLDQYCKSNKLMLNLEKTKVVIFGKRIIKNKQWLCGNQLVGRT
ncbi:hypothetical protein NDU88_011687, partial [Pleurodeles waltl]